MFWRILVIGAIGALGYSLSKRRPKPKHAAFAENQPHYDHTDVRDAGPEAMRDPPQREWTETDEDLDESFPASDPPGGY